AKIIWDRIFDFIQVHYCISDRRDTKFWRDVTERVELSDLLKERLELWKHSAPQHSDFFSTFDFFHTVSYLAILYGMHYLTRGSRVSDAVADMGEGVVLKHQENSKRMSDSLVSQRKWLFELKQYAIKHGAV